jgi:hypothetical protein
MDETELGQRVHALPQRTLFLVDLIRKGEKIQKRIISP